MIRYLRQPDRFSCGPVAIINAIKWAGGCATRKKHLASLKELCDCYPPSGTSWLNFDRALRQVMRDRVDVVRKFNPTFKQINDHVKRDDGCIVIRYWQVRDIRGRIDVQKSSHYSLVIDATPDEFVTVNDYSEGPAVAVVPKWQWRKENMTVAKFPGRSGVPQVWFLTKLDV